MMVRPSPGVGLGMAISSTSFDDAAIGGGSTKWRLRTVICRFCGTRLKRLSTLLLRIAAGSGSSADSTMVRKQALSGAFAGTDQSKRATSGIGGSMFGMVRQGVAGSTSFQGDPEIGRASWREIG